MYIKLLDTFIKSIDIVSLFLILTTVHQSSQSEEVPSNVLRDQKSQTSSDTVQTAIDGNESRYATQNVEDYVTVSTVLLDHTADITKTSLPGEENVPLSNLKGVHYKQDKSTFFNKDTRRNNSNDRPMHSEAISSIELLNDIITASSKLGLRENNQKRFAKSDTEIFYEQELERAKPRNSKYVAALDSDAKYFYQKMRIPFELELQNEKNQYEILNLMNYVASKYLSECVNIILYDEYYEKKLTFLRHILKSYPTNHINGKIAEDSETTSK